MSAANAVIEAQPAPALCAASAPPANPLQQIDEIFNAADEALKPYTITSSTAWENEDNQKKFVNQLAPYLERIQIAIEKEKLNGTTFPWVAELDKATEALKKINHCKNIYLNPPADAPSNKPFLLGKIISELFNMRYAAINLRAAILDPAKSAAVSGPAPASMPVAASSPSPVPSAATPLLHAAVAAAPNPSSSPVPGEE